MFKINFFYYLPRKLGFKNLKIYFITFKMLVISGLGICFSWLKEQQYDFI